MINIFNDITSDIIKYFLLECPFDGTTYKDIYRNFSNKYSKVFIKEAIEYMLYATGDLIDYEEFGAWDFEELETNYLSSGLEIKLNIRKQEFQKRKYQLIAKGNNGTRKK